MNKIEQVKKAIEDAKNEKSKLSNEALQLASFSSYKIKHLLNNLGSISSMYLEIGLHKAGTFICTLYGNNVYGVGIDNWCQFEQGGESKKLAYEQTKKYLSPDKYDIIEADCFQVGFDVTHPKYKFNMFSYDGEHGFENQKKGITYFYPYLQDEFILCVDDTSWKDPKEGTEAGIKEMKLKILFEEHLWDDKEGGDWHNGFSVYLLSK